MPVSQSKDAWPTEEEVSKRAAQHIEAGALKIPEMSWGDISRRELKSERDALIAQRAEKLALSGGSKIPEMSWAEIAESQLRDERAAIAELHKKTGLEFTMDENGQYTAKVDVRVSAQISAIQNNPEARKGYTKEELAVLDSMKVVTDLHGGSSITIDPEKTYLGKTYGDAPSALDKVSAHLKEWNDGAKPPEQKEPEKGSPQEGLDKAYKQFIESYHDQKKTSDPLEPHALAAPLVTPGPPKVSRLYEV